LPEQGLWNLDPEAVLASPLWWGQLRGQEFSKEAGHRKIFVIYMYKYAVFDITKFPFQVSSAPVTLTKNFSWGLVGPDL